MTRIHIQIDNREWDFELPGRATSDDIAAAIADISLAYPMYTTKTVTITDSGWVARNLGPIADRWVAANPIMKLVGTWAFASLAIAAAIWLAQ